MIAVGVLALLTAMIAAYCLGRIDGNEYYRQQAKDSEEECIRLRDDLLRTRGMVWKTTYKKNPSDGS